MTKAADRAQLLENHRVSTCFAPEAQACWRWDENGRTVIWANGETIAFRDEISEILDRLTGQGWPSFTVIVLILAACRGGWRVMADQQLVHAKGLVGDAAQRESVVMVWFGRALTGLEAVSNLPAAARSTTAAKAAIIARVTAAAVPRWSASETVDLLAALRNGCPPAVFREHQTRWWPTLRQAVYALACGLQGIDAAALTLRDQTGVEQLPDSIELPPVNSPTTADQVRVLLQQLVDDPTCGAVARLARELLAATQIPRRLEDPDSLASGGYSDIGNRGTPDRLLVSEFANEDLVFAVRLALNEALYVRREVPPRAPLIPRSLLIDTGIRMWGTARLVAAATALALAASAGPKVPVSAWRTVDDDGRVVPVDLGNRAGVIALLAAQSAGIHPGLMLLPWLKKSDLSNAETDHIVITHPRALADRGFRSAWEAAGAPSMLAATVDDRGEFRLSALGHPGHRTLTEALLDLTVLHAPTPPHRTSPGVTAAERVTPFPLRVPHPCRVEYCWDLGERGVVCALPDGRCTWWETNGQGPCELTAHLPSGRPLLITSDEDEGFFIVLHGQPANRLTLVNVTYSGTVLVFVLDDHPVVGAVFWWCGAVVVIVSNRVVVYRADGARLADHSITDMQWIGRRFFLRGKQFLALSWDGQRINFEPLPDLHLNSVAGRNVTLFDRTELFGPWWTTNGSVFTRCDGEQSLTIPLPRPSNPLAGLDWKVVDLSRDGHRLRLKQPQPGRLVSFDLKKNKMLSQHSCALEPAVQVCGDIANGMLARIKGITAIDGHLAIITMKGALHLLVEEGENIIFRPPRGQATPAQRLLVNWSGNKRCPRWSGECGAIIAEQDMRGVLHLRDSSAELPELAVVLFLGKTAVWSADGNACGSARFLGERVSAHPVVLLKLLRRYAERLT